MTKYWVGVASKNHVKLGVDGGFSQLCHGKHAPLVRMKPGDFIFYYAPKVSLEGKESYQRIIALGKIVSEKPYQVSMGEDFHPYRKDVSFYHPEREVPLSELNQLAEWIEVRPRLRYGHFEISKSLFQAIGMLMFPSKKREVKP